MANTLYAYIVGDATRTVITGAKYIRAVSQSAAHTLAKAQAGLNGTRVVLWPSTIPRDRVAVQDNAGQMEVIDGGAPPPPPQSRLGELYELCRDGTVTGEQMIEAISLLIGSAK